MNLLSKYKYRDFFMANIHTYIQTDKINATATKNTILHQNITQLGVLNFKY